MRIASTLLPLLFLGGVAAQTWIQLPDFPGTARDDAASFSIGDHVFVGTGMEVGWGLTNDWHTYDAVLGTWWPVAVLPASPRQYCSATTLIGQGFLFGGLDANGPLSELWTYDPASGQWGQLPSLPAPGRYASYLFGAYGRLFVATGILEGGSPTNELWQFDLDSQEWSQKASLPGVARHRVCQCGGPVVLGGADANYASLTDGYIYDALLDSWSAYPSLPAARYSSSGVNGVFIAGASSTTEVHNDVWLFESSTQEWNGVSLPPFEGGTRRGGVTGSYWGTNKIYYGLGSDNTARYRDWWQLELPVRVEEHVADHAFAITPNPAVDIVTLHIPPQMRSAHLTVLDAAGRVALQSAITNGPVVNIDALAPGQYVALVTDSYRTLRAPMIKLP